MGVPMVQKQIKRRTSLMLGSALALLLGAAAGFLLLALPIAMIESATTSIGLSALMIQAEPPISPNDRTLLAALAAVITAAVGWVLIDWLLFDRVGMTTLIRPREDEFEEDDDSFRPTDPLDLIVPTDMVSSPDWGGQAVSGDARRPLSARTDIGDPPQGAMPVAGAPAFAPVSFAPISTDELLPPIDQILSGMKPGSGAASQTLDYGVLPTMGSDARDASLSPQAPVGADPIGAHREKPLASVGAMPDWLPSPGIRRDAAAEQDEDVFPLTEAHAGAPVIFEAPPAPPSPPLASPQSPAAIDEFFGVLPTTTGSVAPSVVSDVQPDTPPAPLVEKVAASQIAALGLTLPPESTSPVTASPVTTSPVTASAAPVQRTAAPFGGTEPLDRAMINDLLTRLEKSLQARRAGAANATAADMAGKLPLPAGLAMNAAPAAVPPVAPLYVPPVVRPAEDIAIPDIGVASSDRLIDQPLHLTLDQLRGSVRR